MGRLCAPFLKMTMFYMYKNNYLKTIITLLVLLFAQNVGAETLQEMFINFSNSYAGIWKFMTGIVFLLGLSLVGGSIFSFSKVLDGQQRVSLKVPISMLIIGILLIQANDTITVVEDTFGIQPNNLLTAADGAGQGIGGWSAAAISAVLGFVQILGFIAFVRGLLILNKYNSGEGREGLGSAVTHIVGGIFALNIKWTVETFVHTFAPNMAASLGSFGVI